MNHHQSQSSRAISNTTNTQVSSCWEFRGMSLKFSQSSSLLPCLLCQLLFLFSIHKMFLQYTFLFCFCFAADSILCCNKKEANSQFTLLSVASRESSQYEPFRKTKFRKKLSLEFQELIFMNGSAWQRVCAGFYEWDIRFGVVVGPDFFLFHFGCNSDQSEYFLVAIGRLKVNVYKMQQKKKTLASQVLIMSWLEI